MAGVMYEPPGRSHWCDFPNAGLGCIWRCYGCGRYYEMRAVTGSQMGWDRLRWFPRSRIRWRKLMVHG